MNDDEAAVVMMLRELPQEDSDGARSERVRTRCHEVLRRRRTSMVRTERRPVRFRDVFEFVMVGGFCVVYLSAVAVMALQTRGLL